MKSGKYTVILEDPPMIQYFKTMKEIKEHAKVVGDTYGTFRLLVFTKYNFVNEITNYNLEEDQPLTEN